MGKSFPPLRTSFLPLCFFSSLSKYSMRGLKGAWERDHHHLCPQEKWVEKGRAPRESALRLGFWVF